MSGDKYGDKDFDIVPSGPFEGRPWTDLKTETIESVLKAVELGVLILDERRVDAVRRALATKGAGRAVVSGQ